MQKAMDEIRPEDRRAMDSMGMKMPDLKNIQKNISGVSDAQLKQAYEDDSRIVPKSDAARINLALSTTVSTNGMSAYINQTHQAVTGQLSATSKAKAAEILQQLNSLNKSVASSAVGFWIDGKPALALYLMGEACKKDPNDENNLNNYASFLSMSGAEQMAIPILVNLNKRFPQNSTLFNNLAQAWLGLGDIPRAEKYADSAIRIYASHPQANMAICIIEESKGNIPAAVKAGKKSISEAYSMEKENKLNKLGYKLKSEDINWDPPRPQDPIGLQKFSWPDYPMNVEENKKLKQEWDDFKEACQQKIEELRIRQESLEQANSKAAEIRSKQLLNGSQQGQYGQLFPGYAAKAERKLGPGISDIKGNSSFVFAQELEPVLRAIERLEEHEKILEQKQDAIDLKYKDRIGEGRENPLEAICKDENEIRTEFLKNANGGLQTAYRQYLHYTSRRTSDLLYYFQYTLWPEQFEFMKVQAQISWLTLIKDQKVMFEDKSSWCVNKPITKATSDSLQNFDDVACQYVSTLNLGVYTITSSCSNLVGKFDFGGVKIDVSSNVETGRYSGTAIVGVSKSIKAMGLKGKGTAAGMVEWDNTGITDIGVIGNANVKAGPVTIGSGEVSVTVNSGIHASGKLLGQKF